MTFARPYRRAALCGAVVLALAGCASPPAAVGTTTAEVTLNGADVGTHPVRCDQTGWMWTIETSGKDGGFSAVLRTGPQMVADSVQIRDLGDFNGGFWQGNIGNAKASIDRDDHLIITGEAQGYYSGKPTTTVTAPFQIRATC